MKIKIRKKEDNDAEEQEPIVVDQPTPIQPREQLHHIPEAVEYATYEPISPPDFKKPWEKEETVIKPKRDIKEVERLVDELIKDLQ